jgi:AcrR family transcriptional regulator
MTARHLYCGGGYMPRVTDKYLTDKRDFILECTGEILKEKPLYLITMRDIIKKAGFSQGVIYRYYANSDDIYVDFINKHTDDSPLKQRIDTLLSSEMTEKRILAECFAAMGEYIESMMNSLGGKTFFELIVKYSYDADKRAALFPKLKIKQDIEYAQQSIVEYALSNVEKGVFRPQIPVRSIIMFAGCFMDGIAQSMATKAFEESSPYYDSAEPAADIAEMFQTLAKAVAGFLGV